MLTALLLLVVTGCFQSLPLHISFLGSRIRVPSRFPSLAHFLGGFISSHHDSFPGAGPRPHLISTFTFTAFVLLPLLFPPFFLSTTLLFPPSLPSFSPPPNFWCWRLNTGLHACQASAPPLSYICVLLFLYLDRVSLGCLI